MRTVMFVNIPSGSVALAVKVISSPIATLVFVVSERQVVNANAIETSFVGIFGELPLAL